MRASVAVLARKSVSRVATAGRTGTRRPVFLDVNGVRLHALVFGDGPRTLIAVGGWTGSWEVWEEPIAQLTASGWRCVAYDHRGSGESPVDPALITVEAMIDDVAGVLDALGIERCILAGESRRRLQALRARTIPLSRSSAVIPAPSEWALATEAPRADLPRSYLRVAVLVSRQVFFA